MSAYVNAAAQEVRAVARDDGKVDPVPAFAFRVLIDGVVGATFTSCTGLTVTRGVTELREGGVNDGAVWLHTGLSYGKITLKSGITHSAALWEWFYTGALDGKVRYRQVAIEQIVPYTQRVARRYDLENAMATVWSGPSLDTSSSEVAVETLEIAFRRFKVTAGSAP